MELNPSHSDPKIRTGVRLRALRARAWEGLRMLFEKRKAEGFSQAELAKRLGKSAPQVSRMMGRPQNMTLDTLAAYLDAMDAYAEIEIIDASAAKRNHGVVGNVTFCAPCPSEDFSRTATLPTQQLGVIMTAASMAV